MEMGCTRGFNFEFPAFSQASSFFFLPHDSLLPSRALSDGLGCFCVIDRRRKAWVRVGPGAAVRDRLLCGDSGLVAAAVTEFTDWVP